MTVVRPSKLTPMRESSVFAGSPSSNTTCVGCGLVTAVASASRTVISGVVGSSSDNSVKS